jgi:protein involved in polysaccharide export with SLBB domain
MRNALPVLGLLLAGCGGVTPIHEINEKYRDLLAQRESHYRIKPGDSISVKFYNQDADLNQTLLVLPDGRTDPFFMDDAVFAGRTVTELQEDIRKYYQQQIQNPEISLGVTPVGETIILEGEVESSRSRGSTIQPYTVKMTILQAMGNAGGYKLTARLPKVILIRPYLDPRHPEVYRIDLSHYADSPEDLLLLPNDHIIVKRNWAIMARDYIVEYVWGFLPYQIMSFPSMLLGLGL